SSNEDEPAHAPGAPIQLPRRRLAPIPPPEPPGVNQLDDVIVTRLDEFADATIRAFLQSDRALWSYRDVKMFDPSRDTWATLADWVGAAERELARNAEWPPTLAIVVLLDAGDPRGSELAMRYFERAE